MVDIADTGKGIGDILVGHKGRNFLFEIKDPEKKPSDRKLTKDEEKMHQTWTGQITIAYTAEDVLLAVGYNLILERQIGKTRQL